MYAKNGQTINRKHRIQALFFVQGEFGLSVFSLFFSVWQTRLFICKQSRRTEGDNLEVSSAATLLKSITRVLFRSTCVNPTLFSPCRL